MIVTMPAAPVAEDLADARLIARLHPRFRRERLRQTQHDEHGIRQRESGGDIEGHARRRTCSARRRTPGR